MTKRCPTCGADFDCSLGPQCWCAKLPPAMPLTGESCLCRQCLEALIDARLALRRSAPG